MGGAAVKGVNRLKLQNKGFSECAIRRPFAPVSSLHFNPFENDEIINLYFLGLQLNFYSFRNKFYQNIQGNALLRIQGTCYEKI